MDPKKFKEFYEQLAGLRDKQDKDKLRMLRVKAEDAKLSAQQAKEVAELFKYEAPQHEACMILYGTVDDKQAYETVTLTALKFPAERQKVKEALGI